MTTDISFIQDNLPTPEEQLNIFKKESVPYVKHLNCSLNFVDSDNQIKTSRLTWGIAIGKERDMNDYLRRLVRFVFLRLLDNIEQINKEQEIKKLINVVIPTSSYLSFYEDKNSGSIMLIGTIEMYLTEIS